MEAPVEAETPWQVETINLDDSISGNALLSKQHQEVTDYYSGEPEEHYSFDNKEGSHKTVCYASHGKDLEWRNVCMDLKSKKGGTIEKKILDGMWGSAKAGELSAIMGASGAGKTSLFSVLSGRVRSKGRLMVKADLRLGGAKISPEYDINVRNQFAFVAQEDSLHVPSTPRQALTFSARLRLPRTTSDEEINTIVERFIDDLGLQSCCDTIIGGGLLKGISGGEKRRVSIGVELVSSPALIFLDEPTSGLDAFAARQVVALLQSVARAGNTVLVTIHQPSSNIFSMFDHLCLLHKGRVMHQGKVANIGNDFDSMGHPLPANYNPADWIMDVAQMNDIKALEKSGFFKEDTRASVEPTEFKFVRETKQAPLSTQLAMLVAREKVGVLKNPAPMIINISITSILAIIFGVIFFRVGQADRSDPTVVQSQLGAIVNIIISTMMGQAQAATGTFASERPMFIREYSTSHYSVLTYFLSRLVTEAFQALLATTFQALIVYFMIGLQQTFWQFLAVTFTLAMTSTAVVVLLGSFFSDPKSAQSLFTLVVVPQFYFSGVFIAITLIPPWVRWAQYLCSLMYASRLALAYEFSDCEPGEAQVNCDNILGRNEVDTDGVWWYWLAVVGLFLGFRLLALGVLKQRAREFS